MGENIIHTRTMPWDPRRRRIRSANPSSARELKIVDPEDHTRELGPGEVGEIMFRGPTLFVGYHRQPELTAATRDDEGWFTTGDLGWVDDDGYLFFASRAKEVINRGGTKLYPKAVEDVLLDAPRHRGRRRRRHAGRTHGRTGLRLRDPARRAPMPPTATSCGASSRSRGP